MSGTASADPEALRAYDVSCRSAHEDLARCTARLDGAMSAFAASRPEGIVVPDLVPPLRRHLADATLVAKQTGRVGEAFARADLPHQLGLRTGPAVAPAADVAGWVAALGLADVARRGAALPAAERAAAVERYVLGLSDGDRAWLVRSAPDRIGNLDGVPEELRYAANRLRIERYAGELDGRVARLPPQARAAQQARVAYLRSLLEPWRAPDGTPQPRQFLLFDPTGHGRAAEVIGGTLAGASNVSVMVPGMTSRLDPYYAGFARNAQRLQARAERAYGPGTVVVAWQGYRAPQTPLEVVDPDWARTAGPELDDFVRGQRFRDDQRVTVLAHSYGSTVTGYAAGDRDGLPVDAVVVLGSPGMGRHVDDGRDLRLRPGGDVYAAGARWDFVAASGAHGARPIEAGFGATRLSTDGSSGHSSYYARDSVSLTNLAAVAAGHPEDVRTEVPEPRGTLVDTLALDGVEELDDRTQPWRDAVEDAGRAAAERAADAAEEGALAAADAAEEAARRLAEEAVDLAAAADDALDTAGDLLERRLPRWRP